MELWFTDGTNSGTQLFDGNPGPWGHSMPKVGLVSKPISYVGGLWFHSYN